MGKILALDYGTKRTGIAVTDELQIIASGLTTVETQNLMSFLDEFLVKNQVEALVVGFPLQLDGGATHNTKPVQDFVAQFQKKHPEIPVHIEDERLTSKMAKNSMLDMGLSKKKRQNKALLDEISAVLILQDYLRRNR